MSSPDWQLIDRSVGPRDLSYHITQSVNIDDSEGYRQAFDAYVSDLAEFGVDVDHDWAWEKYRYGTMLGFVYPVIATFILSFYDRAGANYVGFANYAWAIQDAQFRQSIL